ncbi:MAG: dimethyl sulfoxide reductase anchor subunit family protein [Vibrio sp.]
MHELPLVFFTVLAQASVGLLLIGAINQWTHKSVKSSNVSWQLTLVALLLVCLAGVCAIFHLGKPFRAINALFGVGRSPMSNEIFVCGIYGGLLALNLALLQWRAKLTLWITASRIAAVVAGIVLIALIPTVYTLETIAPWDTSFTALQMVLAALTIGGALALIWLPNRMNLVITSVAVIAGLLSTPSYLVYLSSTVPEILQQTVMFFDVKFALYGVALVTAVIGYKTQRLPVAIGASCVFIIAELAGRIAFYNLWSITM